MTTTTLSWKAIARDVALLFLFTFVTGFIAGSIESSRGISPGASEESAMRVGLWVLGSTTLGFFVIGFWTSEGRLAHFLLVGLFSWLTGLFGVAVAGVPVATWFMSITTYFISCAVGGGLASVLFRVRRPAPLPALTPHGAPTATLETPAEPDPGAAFDKIRGRFVLFWIVFTMLLGGILQVAIFGLDESSSLEDAATGVGFTLLLGAGVFFVARRTGLLFRRLYGERPAAGAQRQMIWLATPMLGASFLGLYLLYAPLAFIAPGFVDFMIFDHPKNLIDTSAPVFSVTNILYFLGAVVFAPIVEEFVFRGVLFTRWARKWNPRTAAIASALVFALLHPSWFGTFVFALLATEIYTRTGSLWLPTIMHATHNLMLWALDAAPIEWAPLGDFAQASDMPGSWWLPALGLVLLVPWLPALWRTGRPRFDAPPLGAPRAAFAHEADSRDAASIF